MKRGEKISEPRSIRLGILFLILVLILVISSLSIKLLAIIKSSSFDGVNRYNLAVIHDKSSLEIFSFLPDTHAISILEVIGNRDKDNSIGELLGVPIDAQINLVDKENIDTLLWKVLWDFNKSNVGFTSIDALRLFIFSKTISQNQISKNKINLQDNNYFAKISSLFIDNEIYKEGVTFAIINASEEQGVGGRMAKFITNIGGDVISVTTSTQSSNKSDITYFNKKSYTVSKLKKLLGFSSKFVDGSGIADIVITLGKDSLKLNVF